MKWPTDQDFNEAIQSPRISFTDPELQAGSPSLTPLGLPRPMSGNFATVYKMNCWRREWAVRCFKREIRDQEQRYRAIGEELARAPLPFFVGFEFLSNGIRIHDRRYPILKMEWVEGEPLNNFIGKNLSRPQVFASLAEDWVHVLMAMRRRGIAHGDLQHGNILVRNSRLILIDYDGMFVPRLAGLSSPEEGHPNYQHPARTGRDFGPFLDTFSGWVVLLSLYALAVQPRLWETFDGGDECLLLRRRDFERPENSLAFQTFSRSASADVRYLAERVRSFLNLPLNSVPAVDFSPIATAIASAGAPVVPEWLEHNRSAEALEPLVATFKREFIFEPVDLPQPSWLSNHLEVRFRRISKWTGTNLTIERSSSVLIVAMSLLLGALTVLQLVPLWLSLLLTLVAVAALAVVLRDRYRNLPYFEMRDIAEDKLRTSQKTVAHLEGALRAVIAEMNRTDEPLRDLRERYSKLPDQLRQLHNAAEESYIRDAAKARSDEDRLVSPFGSQAEAELQQQITAIRRAITESQAAEQRDVAADLSSMREQHVSARLRSRLISDARLPGIGTKLSARLRSQGIISAADVSATSLSRVSGIGIAKGATLCSWANSIRVHAQKAAPSSLPQPLADALAERHRRDRASLIQRLTKVQEDHATVAARAANALAASHNAIRATIAGIQSRRASDVAEARRWFETEAKRICDEYRRIYNQTAQHHSALFRKGQELREALQAGRVAGRAIEEEFEAFEAITFTEFLGRVFGYKIARSRNRP